MKKFLISFMALAFVSVPIFAFAQDANTNVSDDTNTNEAVTTNTNTSDDDVLDSVVKTKIEEEMEALIIDPGILPDSPLYFLKEWGEGIKLLLTFDDAKKAELEYRHALRKMAEVQKLIEKGDGEKAREHLAKAEAKILKVKTRLEEDLENGKDVTELIEKLELISARQQAVLLDIYDKVPDVAKDSILKAMENSANGISNAIEKVKGQQGLKDFEGELEEGLKNFGQEMKLKIKTENKGNKTEIQIEKHDDGTTEVQIESDEDDDANQDEVNDLDEEEDSSSDESGEDDDDDTNTNS